MSTTPTEIIEAIRRECTGSVVWRVADPDGAYCIEFDRHSSVNPERDCRDWFADQQRRFPEWVEENGYQVVEARWLSTPEQLACHAADEIARLSAALDAALVQLEAERARNAALVPPPAILLMAARIAADKFEHCTSDPIFTVEKRHVVTGLDLDWCDTIGWFSDDYQLVGEEAASMEAAYQDTSNVPDGYTRTGIHETWQHFATYITQEAAQEFAGKKGEQYRVYVDSGCRNHEWKALRAFLLGIAKVAPPLAVIPGDSL